MCRESDLEGLVLGRLLGRKGGCGQRQNENGAACSACSEFASHDDAPSTFMSSARSPSLSFSLIVAAVERRLLPLRLSMEFHHCSRRDFLTLHDGARSRCIAIDAFNRDGLAASAPYDPAGDLEIHRERDVILAGIGDFTAKPSSLLATLEECLFRSCIHREVHSACVFTAYRDRIQNGIANPEAQNASRGRDSAQMG